MKCTLRFLCRIAIVSIGLPCIAQNAQTWGDLRFGMTELQVRTALKARAFRPTDPNKFKEQPIDKSYGLFAGGTVPETSVKGFDGQATILFEKTSKKLALINLMLTPTESTDADKSFAYTYLKESLLKKYGRPISSSGCGEASGLHECKMLFRTGGQSIDALIDIADQVPLFAFITYAPVGASKGL